MQALGKELLGQLAPGSLVTLRGDLGAGKSVLARAMIHAAGFTGRVKSPTYTLIETYPVAGAQHSISSIAHLDLYRLDDPDELHYLGFDDVLANNDLVLIEWPEKAAGLLPKSQMAISIEYNEDGGRCVSISTGKD